MNGYSKNGWNQSNHSSCNNFIDKHCRNFDVCKCHFDQNTRMKLYYLILLLLLLSNAWLRCDAMLWMLKFSKPILSWCLQNVPCPSHFYLSKTVAAIPFDLDRKIHLLCFCANVNNTHHFSYIVLLILCVCVGVRVRRVVFMCEGATHQTWKIQNIFCPSYLTPTHIV